MAKVKKESYGPSLMSYQSSDKVTRWWPFISVSFIFVCLFFTFFFAYNQKFELKVLAANRVSTLNLKYRVFLERIQYLMLDEMSKEIEEKITRTIHDLTEITTRFSTAQSTLETVLPQKMWRELDQGNRMWKMFAKEVFIGIDTGISGPSGRRRFITNLSFRRQLYFSKLEAVKDMLNTAELEMKSTLEGYKGQLTIWLVSGLAFYAFIVFMMQKHPLLSFKKLDDNLPGFLVPPNPGLELPEVEARPISSSNSKDSELIQKLKQHIAALEKELQVKNQDYQKLVYELDSNNRKDVWPNEEKMQFLSELSHEIRTPLSGIMGMVELLFETPVNKEQEEIISLLKSSNRNLLQLVNSIIQFNEHTLPAKNEFDASRIFKPVNLIEDAVLLFSEAAIHQKGIEIEICFQGTIPDKVESVPHLVYQIIVNLVSNAVKFTDEGGVLVRVKSFSGEKAQGDNDLKLRIEVEDSGIGIKPGSEKYLFKPLVDSADSGLISREGSGLGLAISYQQSHKLGGDMGFTPSSKGGSLFFLDVPIKRISQQRHGSNFPIFTNVHVLCISQSRILRESLECHAALLKLKIQFVEKFDDALEIITDSQVSAGIKRVLFIDEQLFQTESLRKHFQTLDDLSQKSGGETVVPTVLLSPVASRKIDRSIVNERSYSTFLSRPLRIASLSQVLDQIDKGADLHPDTIKYRKRVVPQSFLRVLVVEDVQVSQELFSRQLDLMGLDYQVSESAELATKILDEETFDIILMDCNLPGMDGFEFTRYIRSKQEHAATYIIGVTANANPKVKTMAQSAGMDEILFKPLSLQKLETAIYSRFPEFLF